MAESLKYSWLICLLVCLSSCGGYRSASSSSGANGQSADTATAHTYYGILPADDTLDRSPQNQQLNNYNRSGNYMFAAQKAPIVLAEGQMVLGGYYLIPYADLLSSDGRIQKKVSKIDNYSTSYPDVLRAVAGETGSGNGDYGAMYLITIFPRG